MNDLDLPSAKLLPVDVASDGQINGCFVPSMLGHSAVSEPSFVQIGCQQVRVETVAL